ncbi:MAG: hypothetical protein HY675_28300 [Chloroflexi bacterium]|nr:hypothetical protein [Chloroflexota bacterium]
MPRALKRVDISEMPELLRLVDEARKADESRVLSRGREDVAVLRPLKPALRRTRRQKTKADYAAFLSAAGSWRDVDTEKLKSDIYESRRRSTRPPVEL